MRLKLTVAAVAALALMTAGAAKAAKIYFTYTGKIQQYTAPVTGDYGFLVIGAGGGSVTDGQTVNFSGGYGAAIRGAFLVTAGETLTLLVGGKGGSTFDTGTGGGGGGGSFVLDGNTALIAAGGGGGAGHNGAGLDASLTSVQSFGGGASIGGGGGGGLTSNGSQNQRTGYGGMSEMNGGAGGAGRNGGGSGGFGGGGGGGGPTGYYGGGGGGGYQGGNGGPGPAGGKGGGSYVDPNFVMNVVKSVGSAGRGNGLIVVYQPPVIGGPEPAVWSMMAIGLGAIGASLRVRRKPARAPAEGPA